ncbi:MAG: tetratricopeptide repeat protein [Bacteroidia bacterium]|nr:tetratricopeptide repeat protein [Bacteroidia bacterium]
MRAFLCLQLFFLSLPALAGTADSLLLASEHIHPDTSRARFIFNWIKANGRQNYELKAELSGTVIRLTPAKSSLHGYACIEKGNAMYFLGKYEGALKSYLQALESFELCGDKEGAGHAHHHLGVYKKKLKKYDEAADHFLKANELFSAAGRESLLSSGYNGLGAVYEEQGNYQKAISFYERAVVVNMKYNDSLGLSYSYDYLSGCYGNLGQFRRAIRFLEDALVIRTALRDDFAVAINLNNLGETYYLMKDLLRAEEHFIRSLTYSEKIQFADLAAHTYEKLSQLYSDRNDFEKALFFHRKFKSTKDSILNERSTRQLLEIETRYETAKKEKENLELRETNTGQQLALARSRNWILALISGTLLLLMAGLLFYYRYRAKQRALFDEAMLREQVNKTRAIVEAEEKERQRIARELHDGVGQTLSALKMNLSSIKDNHLQPDVHEKLLSLSDDSVREVRNISHVMMPGALRRSGIGAAIREFLSKLPAGEPVVTLECHGMEEVSDSVIQSILYRVVQEGMNNILKHAGATSVSIQLIRHPDVISLMIEDNGKGFNPDSLTGHSGIGIRNIVTRVESLNGNVTFDSRPGKGTTLNIEIPV